MLVFVISNRLLGDADTGGQLGLRHASQSSRYFFNCMFYLRWLCRAASRQVPLDSGLTHHLPLC